eukprot:scaffold109_cov368-Pavlova_lutheri.AAC.12
MDVGAKFARQALCLGEEGQQKLSASTFLVTGVCNKRDKGGGARIGRTWASVSRHVADQERTWNRHMQRGWRGLQSTGDLRSEADMPLWRWKCSGRVGNRSSSLAQAGRRRQTEGASHVSSTGILE